MTSSRLLVSFAAELVLFVVASCGLALLVSELITERGQYWLARLAYPLSVALQSNDQIFPTFIVQRLPHGIAGLVIAAIFAAAMSNLSGSLNSLSSTTVLDFYKPLVKPAGSEEQLLSLSRWFTAAWGVVLIVIAMVARKWGSVFTAGLTIASLVYGPMLGAFLLGVLTKRANQIGVMSGMATSLGFMSLIWYKTSIAWTWYVLFGTVVCFAVGYAVSLVSKPAETVAAIEAGN